MDDILPSQVIIPFNSLVQIGSIVPNVFLREQWVGAVEWGSMQKNC